MPISGLCSTAVRRILFSSTGIEIEDMTWRKLYILRGCGVLLNNMISSARGIGKLQTLCDGLSRKCNEKLVLFGELFSKQCHFYAAQRLFRMTQVGSLYQRLYPDRSMQRMMAKLVKQLKNRKGKPFGMLLGATLFSWESEKITERDMKRCIAEFDQLSEYKRAQSKGCRNAGEVTDEEGGGWSITQLRVEGWEPVIQKPHVQVWRKAVSCSYLYEYKVFGTFLDIPAWAFFNVQIDTEYRKKWDKLVIALDIIDRDDKEDCEVIHWVMHYPYPMYSRDYVYIRRSLIDKESKVMVLMSRATDHPQCPADKKYVRVKKYFSQMVIRPHKNFEESGFDYLLSYFDDPEAAFPAPAYNWMASSGVPDFVEKLHSAARGLFVQHTPTAVTIVQPQIHSNRPSMQPIYA